MRESETEVEKERIADAKEYNCDYYNNYIETSASVIQTMGQATSSP